MDVLLSRRCWSKALPLPSVRGRREGMDEGQLPKRNPKACVNTFRKTIQDIKQQITIPRTFPERGSCPESRRCGSVECVAEVIPISTAAENVLPEKVARTNNQTLHTNIKPRRRFASNSQFVPFETPPSPVETRLLLSWPGGDCPVPPAPMWSTTMVD